MLGCVFENIVNYHNMDAADNQHFSADTPAYDMMQDTLRIYSGLTWHVSYYK